MGDLKEKIRRGATTQQQMITIEIRKNVQRTKDWIVKPKDKWMANDMRFNALTDASNEGKSPAQLLLDEVLKLVGKQKD